jgi:Leucine-rich repeat (LRR) protein
MEELDIINNNYIHDITPLASLVNLKKLTLVICYNIESIEPISSLVNLKYLNIDYDDTYYEELAALQNLEFLDLSTSYPGMEEIDVVHVVKLSLLKELSIKVGLHHSSRFGRIRNINLLENLVNLEVLSFRNVAPDISWITGLKKLKKFEINDGYIEDLRPLLELPGLVEVNLAFSEIKDISVLLESKTIKKIRGPRLWDNELLTRFAQKGIEYKESYSDR